MNEQTDPKTTGRLKFLLIVAIAVVPIVVAWSLFFYFRELAPTDTTNEGHLVLPPRHIQEIGESTGNEIPLGKWAMLVPSDTACDANCRQLLYLSRQVHTALGRERDRVERYLLVGGDEISPAFSALLTREHGTLGVRYYPVDELARLFGGIVERPLKGDYLFLMDPNGNIMMYYTLEQAGKPMLKDLKHLLRVSTIG